MNFTCISLRKIVLYKRTITPRFERIHMIKLIASDLDGTILQGGAQTVAPELIKVIERLWNEKGIHFVAASGRPYCNLKKLFEDVSVPISYISENGGMYIFHDQIHVPIYHNKNFVDTLIKTVREDEDCELLYSCEDTIYLESKNEAFVSQVSNGIGYSVTPVEDLLTVDVPTMKLAIYNKNGLSISEKKYKDLFLDDVSVITSADLWLDFMPYGATKGAALEHIADTLHIEAKDCMAFGDQWNDVEMLNFVGTSYAMEKAAPGVDAYATHRTNSVLNELTKLL